MNEREPKTLPEALAVINVLRKQLGAARIDNAVSLQRIRYLEVVLQRIRDALKLVTEAQT